MPLIAKGTFVVSLHPMSFENEGSEPQLGRMSVDKQISGDLVATTMGQMLSALTTVNGSAGYVALERVTGALAGKHGSFVLQHSGTMNGGEPSLSVTVVPDSGTGELTGIAGGFMINILKGAHFYEFTYSLPSN
jgi:hypothetical protein